jgi:hypothetical protein
MQFRKHTSVLGWLYFKLLHAKLFRSTAHFYKAKEDIISAWGYNNIHSLT